MYMHATGPWIRMALPLLAHFARITKYSHTYTKTSVGRHASDCCDWARNMIQTLLQLHNCLALTERGTYLMHMQVQRAVVRVGMRLLQRRG